MTRYRSTNFAALLLALALLAPARAQDEPAPAAPAAGEPAATPTEAPPAAASPKVEVVCEGLGSPLAIAIRPGASKERAELLIGDNAGGRVVSYATDKPGEVKVMITGFAEVQTVDGGPNHAGPTALEFLNRKSLLVGGAATGPDDAVLRLFDIDDAKLPMTADTAKQSLPTKAATDKPVKFVASLARNNDAVYASVNGTDAGWLLISAAKAGSLAAIESFADRTQRSPFAAAAFSSKGYLVVTQSPTSVEQSGCRLVFLNPYDAKAAPALDINVPLPAIAALTYSPTSGDLFAAAVDADAPDNAGVYRIDAEVDAEAGTVTAKPVLVAKVAKPTALAFTPAGDLWVTSDAEGGKLLRLAGGDNPL